MCASLHVLSACIAFLLVGCITLTSAVIDPATGYERERVVCPLKSLVYGPGLNSNFNVPARYFYIQARDFEFENFTYTPGPQAFHVSVRPSGRQRGRIQVQLLDRHDGSFIVRYKLYQSYPGLIITVMSGDKHVADSPYQLEGPVYAESCFCPEENTSDWLTEMMCPDSLPDQIQQDFEPFPTIDLDRLAREAVDRFGEHHSLCHYTIVNNVIYRRTFGQHVGFKMFSDAFLTSLTRKVVLPDLEFFVNLGDWPLEKRTTSQSPLPILSWCGSDTTRDIVLPTYDLTESTLETMGRVTLDMMSIQANTGPVWEEKIKLAFWRGRDSRKERLELVKLSRRNPELIDAALTNFFFFKPNDELYGPKVKHVSFFDFFKYKYQINIDGTVAAYRLPYLLAGDSVVFKHNSTYYEHFYKELKPWEHYIPYEQDLSDLKEKIQWAIDNDDKAKQIAENGSHFARNNLLSNNIFCYYYKVLMEYAARQTRSPIIYDDMEEVSQPDGSQNCLCSRNAQSHEEL